MCDQIAIRAGCASARIILGSVSLTGFPGIPGSMLFSASVSMRALRIRAPPRPPPRPPHPHPPPNVKQYFRKNRFAKGRGKIRGEADAMQREIFTQDHDELRDMARAFIAKEIAPYHEQWERDGIVSRDVWLPASRAGLLGGHLAGKDG